MTEKTRAQILGENLANLRIQKKISRKELAAAVGVNEVSFGKYERGESSPNYERLFILAEKLDCSVADIVGDNPAVKDRDVFEYRLQRAIDTAKSLRCDISVTDDNKVTITLPPAFTVDNGNLLGKKIEVNYDISFAPITFDNPNVFISVMESIEKSALVENNYFIKKFQEIFFATRKGVNGNQ